MSNLLLLLPIAITLVAILSSRMVQLVGGAAAQANGSLYDGPGVSACAILRNRGYLSDEFYVTTPDGYILQLTRGRNPLINGGASGLANREPILFIHGAFSGPNLFVINSFGVTPSDLSNTTASQLGAERLKQMASARALPLLAMDLGHEVWFLGRRGSPGSQRRIINGQTIGPAPGNCTQGDEPPAIFAGNLTQAVELTRQSVENILITTTANSSTTNVAPLSANYFAKLLNQNNGSMRGADPLFSVDARFWNFSLDPQIEQDIGLVFDTILNLTQSKQLAAVSHSSGGAILLSALASYPQLNEKLSTAVFWADALYLGQRDYDAILYPTTEPLLATLRASFVVPAHLTNQVQALFAALCSDAAIRTTLCNPFVDLIVGPSANMEPFYPQFTSSFFLPSCTLEFAQSLQVVGNAGGAPRKFNYGPLINQLVYGQLLPPAYDIGRITVANMSFYAGQTDSLVSPQDVEATTSALTVPFQYTLLNTFWNHQGYFYHNENAELAIIPSMIHLEQAQN